MVERSRIFYWNLTLYESGIRVRSERQPRLYHYPEARRLRKKGARRYATMVHD